MSRTSRLVRRDHDHPGRTAQGPRAWHAWQARHQAVIVDNGGPLGKTKAAARLFEGHPHFTIFPGTSVEIMECLPIPAKA